MLKNILFNLIQKKISSKQATDTGMAVTLIFLLLGFFAQNNLFYLFAIPMQVITMSFPIIFTPIAYVWLSVSNILGAIISKLVLSFIYIVILFPVGTFRRLISKDSLQLTQFKKGKASVMITREHEFNENDILNPF